jgi:cobalt-zinc-cadmium efflux system protein
MSTSQIALTVHLVIPEGHPGDAFIENIRTSLHDRFDIEHSTIQIELKQIAHGCEQ